MAIKIHHNTAKKAKANGIEISAVYDSISATDTRFLGGSKAYLAKDGESPTALVERVLKARADAEALLNPKPAKPARKVRDEDAEDGDEGEDESEEDGEDEPADETDEEAESDEANADADEGDAAAAEDEEEEEATGTIVKPKYKIEYDQHDGHCGDEMAEALANHLRKDDGSLDMERMLAVGYANGIDVIARWGHLKTNGQRRMNLSNMLRAKFRRGEPVYIGAVVLQQEPEEK